MGQAQQNKETLPTLVFTSKEPSTFVETRPVYVNILHSLQSVFDKTPALQGRFQIKVSSKRQDTITLVKKTPSSRFKAIFSVTCKTVSRSPAPKFTPQVSKLKVYDDQDFELYIQMPNLQEPEMLVPVTVVSDPFGHQMFCTKKIKVQVRHNSLLQDVLAATRGVFSWGFPEEMWEMAKQPLNEIFTWLQQKSIPSEQLQEVQLRFDAHSPWRFAGCPEIELEFSSTQQHLQIQCQKMLVTVNKLIVHLMIDTENNISVCRYCSLFGEATLSNGKTILVKCIVDQFTKGAEQEQRLMFSAIPVRQYCLEYQDLDSVMHTMPFFVKKPTFWPCIRPEALLWSCYLERILDKDSLSHKTLSQTNIFSTKLFPLSDTHCGLQIRVAFLNTRYSSEFAPTEPSYTIAGVSVERCGKSAKYKHTHIKQIPNFLAQTGLQSCDAVLGDCCTIHSLTFDFASMQLRASGTSTISPTKTVHFSLDANYKTGWVRNAVLLVDDKTVPIEESEQNKRRLMKSLFSSKHLRDIRVSV